VWSTSAAATRTARIEERKHFLELGLKVALINFEKVLASAQQLANITGRTLEHPHFEVFVIKGIKFMDIVATPNISATEIAGQMNRLQDFTETIINANKQKH